MNKVMRLIILGLTISMVLSSQAYAQNCETEETFITYQGSEKALTDQAQENLQSFAETYIRDCPTAVVLLVTPIPESMETSSPEWTLAIQRSTIIAKQLIYAGIPKALIQRQFPSGALSADGRIDISIQAHQNQRQD